MVAGSDLAGCWITLAAGLVEKFYVLGLWLVLTGKFEGCYFSEQIKMKL
ncbi:hypothetical protein [Microcystis phage MaeS]|nr:hypothetical protein [Microcystis phage MaeS]